MVKLCVQETGPVKVVCVFGCSGILFGVESIVRPGRIPNLKSDMLVHLRNVAINFRAVRCTLPLLTVTSSWK